MSPPTSSPRRFGLLPRLLTGCIAAATLIAVPTVAHASSVPVMPAQIPSSSSTIAGAPSGPGYAIAAPAAVSIGKQALSANGVNLNGAASWALANWNGIYYFNDDCTDFVSRALAYGGGDPMTVGGSNDHYWYFFLFRFGMRYTLSWSVSQDLAIHLWWRHSYFLRYWNNARPGDVIFANWNGSNFYGITHAGLVTGMRNGAPLITQHSPSQKNIPLSYWLTHGGKNVHVWIASPAPG